MRRKAAFAFAHVQRFVDDLVTVDDEAIVEAALRLFRTAKLAGGR